jgi:hypothetical protein
MDNIINNPESRLRILGVVLEQAWDVAGQIEGCKVQPTRTKIDYDEDGDWGVTITFKADGTSLEIFIPSCSTTRQTIRMAMRFQLEVWKKEKNSKKKFAQRAF